jgi:hypothetical protein
LLALMLRTEMLLVGLNWNFSHPPDKVAFGRLSQERGGGKNMTSTETQEVATVAQRIKAWPAAMRLALARQILETLEWPPPDSAPSLVPRGPSAAEVAARLRTDKSAPDDATVRRWIEEHRLEKYGR